MKRARSTRPTALELMTLARRAAILAAFLMDRHDRALGRAAGNIASGLLRLALRADAE